MGYNRGAWVTSVTRDEDVQKALILCRSLRKAYTTRTVAVLVSPTVNADLRKEIAKAFDAVFCLDLDEKPVDMHSEDFGMLYGIRAMKMFEKCVYLSPSSIVVQNCDEIFRIVLDQDFVFSKHSRTITTFLFHPSLERFETMLLNMRISKCTDVCLYLKTCMETQASNPPKFLDTKYNAELIPGSIFTLSESQIGIIHFSDGYYPSHNPKTIETLEELYGPVGKIIGAYWLTLCKPELGYEASKTKNELILPGEISLHHNQQIAIIGMSLRFPKSDSLDEFWEILVKSEDATSMPPSSRWQWNGINEELKTNAGYLKTPIDEADARFFGFSPKEILNMDPQHRLLHELVWEALEEANINPLNLRGSSGSVYIGCWMNEYKEVLNGTNDDRSLIRNYMGNSLSAAASRISFMLGLKGPSFGLDTACSSSMCAVHLACQSLLLENTNLALACGVNLILQPFDANTMPMLSQDGHCKAFSADADGFARAEGCAVLVLKRYSDAVKDGDHIWALVRGSAVSQEGLSSSMGTPTLYTESLVMKNALVDARVKPEEVSFVEAHGTGTEVGDPMEIAAIAEAYWCPKRKKPLLIGTVKTNIGHTESCSGIAGIIKVVLSMHHEIIPAHRNFTTLNPTINLDAIPAEIPMKSKIWKRNLCKRRIAGVSSFGITGTEAHVIIEEAPIDLTEKALTVQANSFSERPYYALKISARSKNALKILLGKYRERLGSSHEHETISDITYSANKGRSDFTHRAIVLGSSKCELKSNLDTGQFLTGTVPDGNIVRKVCFLFTGQGSQYKNMAKCLYEAFPVFRIHFDFCNNFLLTNYDINIKEVIWASSNSKQNDSILNRTIYSQTSIFCVEYALCRLWQSWGVQPDFVLGHSSGEFCAAVISKLLSVQDAITLVAERSLLIEALPEGKMLVVRGTKKDADLQIQEFLATHPNKTLDIAALNSEQQTVIAGNSDLVLEFSNCIKKKGVECSILEATHAFHSREMDLILDKYRQIANGVSINVEQPSKPRFISSTTGKLVENHTKVNSDYWVEHTRSHVNFVKAAQQAIELDCQVFLEIGPQPVLTALMLDNAGPENKLVCLPSLRRGTNEWKTMLSSLSQLYIEGVPVDWKGMDMFRSRKNLPIPTYPFQRKRFWPHVQEQCIELEKKSHPLLGKQFSNASNNNIFHNSRLMIKNLEYVKDHCIGHCIVFPGACYLEICLFAGWSTVMKNMNFTEETKLVNPLTVENLEIVEPLQLHEEHGIALQTVTEVVVASKSGAFSSSTIKIFHREASANNARSNWMAHAHGNFSLLVDSSNSVLEDISEKFMNTIQQSTSDIPNRMYKEFAKLGFRFGPHFQSLERCWLTSGPELLAQIKFPKSQIQHYIVHPVVIDAMLQAIVAFKLDSMPKRRIVIPIKVGRFVLLANVRSLMDQSLYVYVVEQEDRTLNTNWNSPTVYLLNQEGNVIAVMENVEFVETTSKAIVSVLKHQRYGMPEMWEEIWHPKSDLSQSTIDVSKLGEAIPGLETISNIMGFQINENKVYADIINQLNKLIYWIILTALYERGWNPQEVDTTFDENILFSALGIKMQFKQQFAYFLAVLEEENILSSMENGIWKVVNTMPSATELESSIETILLKINLVENLQSAQIFKKIKEHLSNILCGMQLAQEILFPVDESTTISYIPSVSKFYQDFSQLANFSALSIQVFNCWFEKYKLSQNNDMNQVLRILEIGAGTGRYTQDILQVLNANKIKFEYYYTDISSGFFEAASKKFEKYLAQLFFKKLNIEEDPLSQNFYPEYYDIVVAAGIIHATKNLKETILNVGILLKPHGIFHMYEPTQVSRMVTFIFGLLEGFWRFEDFDIRKDHCMISREKWTNVLENCGFSVVAKYPFLNDCHTLFTSVRKKNFAQMLMQRSSDKTWLVFHYRKCHLSCYLLNRLKTVGRKTVKVTKGSYFSKIDSQHYQINAASEQDYSDLLKDVSDQYSSNLEGVLYCWSLDTSLNLQEDILQPYFYMIKALELAKLKEFPKVSVLTSGAIATETSNFWHLPSSTLVGFTRSYNNECSEHPSKLIDVGGKLDEKENENFNCAVFLELWHVNKADLQVGFFEYNPHVPNLCLCSPKLPELSIPYDASRIQLVLPSTKSIADLKFGPSEYIAPGPKDIEVKVVSFGLNFRDVLTVLKPSEAFENFHIGLDFAGVITGVGSNVSKWKIGDSVFGINTNKLTSLPSHVIVPQESILEIPEYMTFAEASTLPAVGCTNVHCLLDIAKVTRDDTVLIHTASGGVGLCALQICQYIGAKIICTAGSQKKQAYLRNLNVQHVFHSRNTKYSESILKVTNDLGVTVVLNSLTGPGFKEATLKACAQGARFIEISKYSIWTTKEVSQLRPDIQYTIVDLSTLEQKALAKLMEKLSDLLNKRVIQPYPYARFNGTGIRYALGYLQKAKHIGKVVCVMPEIKRKNNGDLIVHTPLFNDRSTYLITGGFGGIGSVLAKWMVDQGAKHVVLAGRRSPSQKYLKDLTEFCINTGANIITALLDVADYSQCETLINKQIGNEWHLPPLRGIMHAAGTLHDGLVTSHNWETLSETFAAKIYGTENLNRLTSSLKLEHFVLFSSAASVVGASGQANHSAANYFEDITTFERVWRGQPATTINWGQWSEVGIAVDKELHGFRPLSNQEAFAALEHVLTTHRTETFVATVESVKDACKMYPNFKNLIEEKYRKRENEDFLRSITCAEIDSETFWNQYDRKCKHDARMDLMQSLVSKIVRKILHWDQNDKLDEHTRLEDLGVDSLLFIELKNELQQIFGERLTLNTSLVREFNNVNCLAKKLVELLEQGVHQSRSGTNEQTASWEEINQLISEDICLDEEIRAKPEQKRINLEDVSRVLVTGCTGNLGPYVIRELALKPQLKMIYCLVRQTSIKESDSSHLERILSERDLAKCTEMSKIHDVYGNVAQPKLGLRPEIWTELCNTVDAVFHMAAMDDHVDIYTKLDKQGMRKVNVDGLKQILRFCASGEKLKHIYFSSSLAAVGAADPRSGNLNEKWPKDIDFNSKTSLAYPVTKFIGDVLLRKSILERGIPGKVFRFPQISGNSKTGRFVLKGNHFMLRNLYILQTGIVSSTPAPIPLLPVDVCAEVSVNIFFNKLAPNDVYNVAGLNPYFDQDFVEVAKRLGYCVEIREFSEFVKPLMEPSLDKTEFALLKGIYSKGEHYVLTSLAPAYSHWQAGGKNNEDYFKSKKIEALIPEFYRGIGKVANMEFVFKDLLFAKAQGWLPTPKK